MQNVVRFLIKIIMRLISDISISGYENVPQSGGFIIAANHLGRLDSALLYYFIDRQDLIMPVAEKYKDHWLFRPLVLSVGGFFINRFDADLQAIREVLKRLKNGGVFVIAPEGTRSKTESLLQARPGVSYFASKTGMPILPVAITGTEDRSIVANLKKFKRSKIHISAGETFTLTPIKSSDDAGLLKATDEIMCRIGSMLPEKYRGYYAEHARLKELLGDS